MRTDLEERKQGILGQFFAALQRHFGSIFRILVPMGHAGLVLYGEGFELSAEQEVRLAFLFWIAENGNLSRVAMQMYVYFPGRKSHCHV